MRIRLIGLSNREHRQFRLPHKVHGLQYGSQANRARQTLSQILFDLREKLGAGALAGEADNAQEVLAAALVVYPRSRPLRSLYYIASALSALEKGEVMLATSQLETALAHHEQCVEASAMLEHMRKHGQSDLEALKRLFK